MLQQTNFVDDMKEEGREEERKKIIQNMLSKGFSIKQIAEIISMPEDIVKSYL